MIRVKVYKDGEPIQRVDLRREDIIIGRDGGADVQLPSQAVSRRHARLTKTDEGWQVSDLGAANGVYVAKNGGQPERIVIHTVAPDDVIIIETFSIKIEDVSANDIVDPIDGVVFEDEENSLETKRTQFISMVDVLKATDGSLSVPVSEADVVPQPATPKAPAPTAHRWWVRISSTSGHDRVFPIEKQKVLVGTDEQCGVRLPSGPSQIARLEREGPTVTLARTAKWPFPRLVVDGEPVKNALLNDGDSFLVGDLEIVIHLAAAPGRG